MLFTIFDVNSRTRKNKITQIKMSKNSIKIIVLYLSVFFFLVSCYKEIKTDSPYIEGLSIDNYPIIDGSTSTLPLNTIVACELLGLSYVWEGKIVNYFSRLWGVEPQIASRLRRKFDKRVMSSTTHDAFINLIDNKAEIALTARTLSADEKAYADSKGVMLVETPIALDAFIFIVNSHNKAVNLTTENIQDIYTGKVTDWSELGIESENSTIRPYIRNPNSGSQELMDMLIMKDLEYIDLPMYEETLVSSMAGMFDKIALDKSAIGYSVYYYNEYIIRPEGYIKTIAIDGVRPDIETISDKSYPYTTEVYAVIRSDIDKSSMAYKVYQWLQTEEGRQAIKKSGYIPN